MEKKEIIGIDVSKETLDVFIFSESFHFQTSNCLKGYQKLRTIVGKKLLDQAQHFYCFEDTGKYSLPLCVYLHNHNCKYVLLSSLELKRSMGIIRGKSDKKDARMISRYAWQRRDELVASTLPASEIILLKQLCSLRNKLIKQRTSNLNALKDIDNYLIQGCENLIKETQLALVNELSKHIEKIDQEIEGLVLTSSLLRTNYQLLLTVSGVGKGLASYLLAYTHNFTRFEDARKFCCFCGVAPFEYTSGSSVKGRTKVSHLANKRLKTLLNMAAMSCITHENEYKTYYNRRVGQGKNKMSTLNIIRNKIIFRVFAVIKRQTPYVNLQKFAG